MSIAIINATISGTLVVGGTSTLTGALTSGSTLNAQGITSTTMNLTSGLIQTGASSISTGTTGLLCNGNATITGNTLINSNCSVLGNIILSQNLVAGATTITNTSLGFISGLTSNAQTQINTGQTQSNAIYGNVITGQTQANNIYGNVITLQQKTTGISYISPNPSTTISGNLTITGNTYLNSNPLYLKTLGDNNHSLIWNTTSDGPALQGFLGGRLGTVSKGDIITWNTTGGVHRADVNGSLNIASANEVRLNTAPLYLKSIGDNNHLLQYVGAPYDGVALQGNGGGKIGTTGKSDMINWTSSAGINTVNIGANTNLTGNVNILPYTSNTTLSAYTLNCNAVTCLGQIVAGGVGITTAKLQVSNNGTGILGLQCGSFQASTNANQTVTFPNAFLGSNAPLVFLQPVYAFATTGTAYVISTSLTNFVYRFFFDGSVNSESAVLMYWSAYQI